MTDLCLMLATLTGSELSNILWLTFGIFALWSILLTHLEMLTWMTVGSESNDRRQWLLSSFSRMGCSYNYHRHSNLRRQQTKPCGVASRANRALPGSRANNPKYSPFSENSKEPTMSIQDWQTAVRLSFQKCNFPIKAEDRLQRDIFVIGLNDT